MLVTDLFSLVSVRPFVITRIADVITGLLSMQVSCWDITVWWTEMLHARTHSQRADRNSLLPLEVLCSRELKNVNFFCNVFQVFFSSMARVYMYVYIM